MSDSSNKIHFLVGDLGEIKLRGTIIAHDLTTGQYTRTHHELDVPTVTISDQSELVRIFRQFKSTASRMIRAPISVFALGIAGPVEDNHFDAGANLPAGLVGLRGQDLAKRLGCARGFLLNDCLATGEGIESLGPEDLVQLNPEVPCTLGNRCVAGAGTGLGLARIRYERRQSEYIADPSELCHSDFGPNGAEQRRLLEYLSQSYGHVSWDRVVSGPGIEQIFRFLHQERTQQKGTPDLAIFSRVYESDNRPATIAEFALGGEALCCEVMRIFVECYAAVTANLSLDNLSKGAYLSGGIAPQIEPLIRKWFMPAFVQKGRLGLGGSNPILTRIPVFLIRSVDTALYGAAHYAMRELNTPS